jgi:hypothetical protein
MKNNMKKDIYGGINPIFESLRNSLNEDSKSGKKIQEKGIDTTSSVVTALNTLFTLLLSSKMEDAKTSSGFETIKNKILLSENFGSFRQYILSMIDSFSKLDNTQKEAYDSNIKMVTSLLSGNVESSLSDPKIFNTIKKDTIAKLLSNFSEDIRQREVQMKKTNPKIYSEAAKNGLIVKESEISEEKRTGDETDVTDAEFRGKAFNKSKESLDASNAFVGMIDRDKYVPLLKDNPDVSRFKEIADNLYKKAQDLQMLDREGLLGGKIVTATGEFRSVDYKRKQDDLINEIIRQKKEYERLKNSLLKNQGAPVVIEADPICPEGQYYDKSLGKCVDIKRSTDSSDKPKKKIKPVPVPLKKCDFPIKMYGQCTQVGEVQEKLSNLLPSVKKYLSKYGGVDNIYGKATAAVCNIVFAYITDPFDKSRSLKGELTQAMYDRIMSILTPGNDVGINTQSIIIKEGINGYFEEMSLDDKIQEMEEINNAPVLSFEDFFSVLEETYSFRKLDEKTIPPGSPAFMLYDNCVEMSLAKGEILLCSSVTGSTGTTGATGATGATGEKAPSWKGLKPVKDGAYTVYYDESWEDWWTSVGKGALVAGLIVGAVIITGGAAGIPIAGMGLAGTAGAVGAGASIAALGTTAGATVLAAGAIGGSAIAKWAGDDRQPVTILVFNGYIDSLAVRGMARGLYNSLTGTVSSQDLLAIYSTLILSRGTFTDNGNGKAVSVWSQVKKQYTSLGGGNIMTDIASIGTDAFKDIVTDMDDIPSFPASFKTKNPLKGGPIDFNGAKDMCIDGVRKLQANGGKIGSNLKNITEEDLEVLSDGMEEITPKVSSKMKKMLGKK